VALQLLVDGSAIANRVQELDACQAQLPATPAEEIEQDVQQQSSVTESQRAVADGGSRPEELLTTDPEKDEQHDLAVHSCDRPSKQVAKGGKESCTPTSLSLGAHRIRVAGILLKFVATLGAVLLMCAIFGSLGFRTSLEIPTNMTYSDPGDGAMLKTDWCQVQPQE